MHFPESYNKYISEVGLGQVTHLSQIAWNFLKFSFFWVSHIPSMGRKKKIDKSWHFRKHEVLKIGDINIFTYEAVRLSLSYYVSFPKQWLDTVINKHGESNN